MSSHPMRLTLIIIGLCGILFSTSPLAVAQSDRELRRELESLRSENDTLRQQLADLTTQIGDLQARNARLEAALAQRPSGTTTTPPPPTTPAPVSIDESKADASPRALFNAMLASHDEAMKDLIIGEDMQDKDRRVYLRDLSRWVRQANRDFKSQILWHVRVIEGRQLPGEFLLRVIAIDPVHGTELGGPFDVLLSRTVARHVIQIQERGSLDTLVLRGGLQPAVQLNPDRADEGPFNNPLLLGPFVEFGLGVIATSMITKEQDAKDAAERKKSAGGG